MRPSVLVLASVLVSMPAFGSANAEQGGFVTNLVEMLTCIEQFANALQIELPSPLTTNHVTGFKYIKYIEGAGIEIERKWQFCFDARTGTVDCYTDLKHSMVALWRPEDIERLLQPSKLTKPGAIRLAWTYLNRLGYYEGNLPVLSPKVKHWVWAPANQRTRERLPYYTIEWPWKDRPELNFMTVEIDGIRARITHLSFLRPPPAVGKLSFPKAMITSQEIE
jgi:hypothetical protein